MFTEPIRKPTALQISKEAEIKFYIYTYHLVKYILPSKFTCLINFWFHKYIIKFTTNLYMQITPFLIVYI